jgi:Uma2 family endonuclease
MSTDITTQPMTAEQFYDWVHRAENANRWFELVRGEVIELPRPLKLHGRVCMNVGYLLEAYVRQRNKGYVISNDSGVVLSRAPDTVRGPDIAVYEDADSFDDLHPKYGETPPRLAVEVLSPNDKAGKLLSKIADYLNNGVELVWLVDPEERIVNVHRPQKNPYQVKADAELTGDDVLPGFRCRVAEFFFVPGSGAKESTPNT